MTTQDPPVQTLRQIIEADGKSAPGAHTSPLWVTSKSVFSQPTGGNTIKHFTTGEDYFLDLITEINKATKEVFIAGWQVNWDALMKPGYRLYDLVYANAKRGVNFYVMPWDDTNPVQTYETQTSAVLQSINDRLKTEKIAKPGTVIVISAKLQTDENSNYFSHHQKQVVIDSKIGYIGGIDLAYGRFDDATFDLHSKANGRLFLNSYNPGLPAIQPIKAANTVDPDFYISDANTETIKKGGYQTPYTKNTAINNKPWLEGNTVDLNVLDVKQPRQPWQDVHSRMEGPVVAYLARNFTMRWNTLKPKTKLKVLAAPTGNNLNSGAEIQVLRSASAEMRTAAYQALQNKKGVPAPSGIESDIQKAMKHLIGKAHRFIYIESQFFVSGFGTVGGLSSDALSPAAAFIKAGAGGITDDVLWGARSAADGFSKDDGVYGRKINYDPKLDRLPSNGVCLALVARIVKAILDDDKPYFHAYITLPVHPEGSLLDASTAVQVFWTMQTIAFGSQSLLNGIKRGLKARELRDVKKDKNWLRALDEGNNEYDSVATEECFEYVTLLNLRNWAKLDDGNYITEQVYVHTKLMIVDDLYALLGSANINDRSLLGNRDSEIAILVKDQATRADINGDGSKQPVRTFAHELRMAVWNKIFGITANVRPVGKKVAQAVKHPGKPDSWRKLQIQAQENAALYEAAFPWVPRSNNPFNTDPKIGASVLPTWNSELKPAAGLNSPLPPQTQFWSKPRHTKAVAQLDQIKGFITALPAKWTKGENIWIKYPTAIVADNGEVDKNKSAQLAALQPDRKHLHKESEAGIKV